MKRAVSLLFVLVIGFAPPAAASLQCSTEYTLVWTTIDGWSWWPIYIPIQHCYEVLLIGGEPPSTGGSGGGDHPGGEPPAPSPDPPTLSINYVSDENPHNLVIGITYSSNTAVLNLYKNGTLTSSISPTTIVSFGSLDNLSADYSLLTIEACNADGCAEGGVNVSRADSVKRASGYLSVTYYDLGFDSSGTPTLSPKTRIFSRTLKGHFLITSYANTPTVGARSGRVLHLGSTDSLLWSDTPAAPAWIAYYYVYPWWGYVAPYEEFARGGCTAAIMTPDPYQSSLCADIAEYAADWDSHSYSRLESLGGLGLPFAPTHVGGDVRLDIHP